MRWLALAVTLFLSACSVKNYEISKSKIVIIKSPKLKFADLAYIRNSENSVEIELFVAGKSVQKIAINHIVCVHEGCMSKSGFNEEYLNKSYPDDLLQNVVLGHTIYEGKNREQSDDGFTQNIVTKNVDITYKVTSDAVFFKDKRNKIILKIKDVK